MSVNRHLEIACERLDLEGRGVGVSEGLEVVAPDWLTGETALLEIDHVSPHQPTAWARVVEHRGPRSRERVTPACPAYGHCGGCRLQHLSGASQLALKRRRLVEALESVGLGGVEVADVVAAPEQTGYRNKGKYVFGRDSDGGVVLGAFRPRSHEIVSTLGCRVVEPAIDACAANLAARVAQSDIAIYSERDRSGWLRYAIIRAGHDGAVAVALITRSSAVRSSVEALAEALVADGCRGVAWAVNDRVDGGLLANPAEAVAGDVEVVETQGGLPIKLPITAFAQVNRTQASRLIERLVERLDLEPGAEVLDAYAGAGAIAFALAVVGMRVSAVEIEPTAVTAGLRAAAVAGLEIDFEITDAAQALQSSAGFDAVVVNPPRKGLSDPARAALIGEGCRRIAYVSCGPVSLARDLAALSAAGYRIDRVEPFDLMPGTPEIESLTLCFKD